MEVGRGRNCRNTPGRVPSVDVDDLLQLVLRAGRQHQLVTSRDARELEISPYRWRKLRHLGWWLPVTPVHFRHVSVPLTFEMQARAGTEWLGRHSALFGSSALHWLGVPSPEPRRAEFLASRARRSAITWMIVHTSQRWDRADVINHNGVRTSTAARAIIDLAFHERSARRIEAAIDESIRLRLTSLPTLRRRLAKLSGTGRHGCRLVRELLLDSGGESFLERRFLRIMRDNGLPRPECQVTFRDATDKVLRVDFVFGAVVVEVSGRLGHASDRERQRAARRRNELQQQGVVVLEFTTADVIDDPDHVVRTLRRSLPVTSISRTSQKMR